MLSNFLPSYLLCATVLRNNHGNQMHQLNQQFKCPQCIQNEEPIFASNFPTQGILRNNKAQRKPNIAIILYLIYISDVNANLNAGRAATLFNYF